MKFSIVCVCMYHVCSEIILRPSAVGNMDARLQGIDHRTRMLLQRPQTSAGLPQQHFQSAQTLQTRLPAARNAISEPYDILHQQRFAGTSIEILVTIYNSFIISVT